jgi:hypothetical protein
MIAKVEVLHVVHRRHALRRHEHDVEGEDAKGAAMAALREPGATTTTATRYTIATFTMSNRGVIANPARVQSVTPAAALA